jgi:membrane protease YdiL (CAAX protease family)
MYSLIRYLQKEVSWPWVPILILAAVCSSILLIVAASSLLVALKLNTHGMSNSVMQVQVTIGYFITVVIPVVIIEEGAFRAPLTISAIYGWHRTTLVILVSSSIIFGLIHGNVLNLLFQGVGGIILGLVYLKCGGMQGKYLKPMFVSTVTHICINGFIFAMIFFTNHAKA